MHNNISIILNLSKIKFYQNLRIYHIFYLLFISILKSLAIFLFKSNIYINNHILYTGANGENIILFFFS